MNDGIETGHRLTEETDLRWMAGAPFPEGEDFDGADPPPADPPPPTGGSYPPPGMDSGRPFDGANPPPADPPPPTGGDYPPPGGHRRADAPACGPPAGLPAAPPLSARARSVLAACPPKTTRRSTTAWIGSTARGRN